MSIIRVEDIAYVHFNAPDLEEMGSFLRDFGLQTLPINNDTLYARGIGNSPVLHVTTRGQPSFVALAFRASSVSDLNKLAAADDVPVEDLLMPGGGKIVRLTDPDGGKVEVVAGQQFGESLTGIGNTTFNSVQSRDRVHSTVRIPSGASNVVRLGHAVLRVTNFRASESWYKSRFGFITSDEVEKTAGTAMGAFLRCDRGEIPTDHHTLFLLQGENARFGHAAFEVENMDDLMRGHVHLREAKREHAWGVGRHILGSAIADYWKDPWGHGLEHWTDGDLLTAADGSRMATLEELENAQWGPA